jgi:pimeloyl-ACP methyl ester carboxylesterase
VPRPPALLLAVLAAALLGAGCSATAPAEPPEPPPVASPSAAPPAPTAEPEPAPVALDWQPCEEGFECATLPVVLAADAPAAGSVELAVTRRPAADPAQRIGSLVVNPGGPGASAVDYLQAAWKQVPEPVRARFDLVAVDPRGVGRSAPVRCLDTAGSTPTSRWTPDPDDDGELAELQAGNRRLVDGLRDVLPASCCRTSRPSRPRATSTCCARRWATGAHLPRLLHGTSIGAAYLDRYPGASAAMVLDGGIDPTLSWDALLAGQSTGFDAALTPSWPTASATRCAFRPRRRRDLGAAYDALAARVEERPLPGDGRRPSGPGEFSLGVGAGLYSRDSGWPAIASGLAQAHDGDGSTLLALSDSYLDRTDGGYANVSEANLAVNCTDRPWPRDVAPYLALADRVEADAPRFGRAIALSGLACSLWPVEAVREPAPVTGEGAPPVVVVGTTRDPATPYAWSQALAAQLSSGVLLTYDGDGHTVYRAGAPACVRDALDAYLLTATAPPETRC